MHPDNFWHFLALFIIFWLFSFFSTSLLTVQYFLPMAIISVAYSRIAFRLWGSKTPGAAQDERDHIILANKKKVSSIQGCRNMGDSPPLIYHMNILILLKTERMRCKIFWLKKIVKMHDDRATDHYSRIFQIPNFVWNKKQCSSNTTLNFCANISLHHFLQINVYYLQVELYFNRVQ